MGESEPAKSMVVLFAELDEPEEEHAATDIAIATTALPITVTCLLPQGCIWVYLLVGLTVLAATSSTDGRSAGRPVPLHSRCWQTVSACKSKVDRAG
jgi:hypothetical protein